MKLLKKIFIGILIFIVLLLVLAYFLPRKVEVLVTEKIDAPSQYSYNLLNDFKNLEKWDPWTASDTNVVYTYGEKTLGEGAYIDFKGENMGTGRSTRTSSKKNERIVLTAVSEDNGNALMSYDFKPNGEATDLSWKFSTEIGWPRNLMGFLIKSSMKKDMKKGLKNISTITNDRWKNNKYDGYIINKEIRESMHYVTNRDVVPFDQADKYHSQSLQPLFLKIQQSGVKMEGHASALVYNFDEENMTLDMAAAIPIKEEVAIEGAGSETLEAGKVLVVDYYGDKANTTVAHFALDDYMRDRGLFNSYPVIEEYITDPMEEKDPNKWLTKVVYYLSE